LNTNSSKFLIVATSLVVVRALVSPELQNQILTLLETGLGFLLLAFALDKTFVRTLSARFARNARNGSSKLQRTLVIGTDAQAEPYLNFIRRNSPMTDVVGFLHPTGVQPDRDGVQPDRDQVAETHSAFQTILRKNIIDEVVVCSPDGLAEPDLAMSCAERGIAFRALVRMPESQIGHYTAVPIGTGSYLLSLELTPNASVRLSIKRALDIIGGTVGLFLCGLAYLWYGRRIKRQSRESVLFRQTRVGRNGRLFTLYKFRTMYADAEERLGELNANNEMRGCIFKMRDDPRITALGKVLRKTHLDELPQFWNVLKGEMSLVGTRPPTPNEVELYEPHHHRRLSMKPGITGLWQLHGNGEINDFDEVVRLDCQYLDNWSLWLDVKILFRTVLVVLTGNGW
jgi:exopolysaccharide biosynthesis polyprenyl glycosylphosphotransferase